MSAEKGLSQSQTPPDEAAVVHLQAGKQAAKGESLAEGGSEAPEPEGKAPEGPVLKVLSQVDAHTPENEAEEHEGHGDVERGEEQAVEEREGAEEHAPEHHEPGLVCRPDAFYAEDHDAALFGARGKSEMMPMPRSYPSVAA